MSNLNKIRNRIKEEMIRLNLEGTYIWSSVNGIPAKTLTEREVLSMVRFGITYNQWVLVECLGEDKLMKIPVDLLNLEYIREYFPKGLPNVTQKQ